MALTESRDLHSVKHDSEQATIEVTWMNRIYRDGYELDAARTAEIKNYSCTSQEDAAQFETDLGVEAAKYTALFQ